MPDINCSTCGHTPHMHWPNIMGRSTTNCLVCEEKSVQKVCDATMFSIAYDAGVSTQDKSWGSEIEGLCTALESRADELIDPGPEVLRGVVEILKDLVRARVESG